MISRQNSARLLLASCCVVAAACEVRAGGYAQTQSSAPPPPPPSSRVVVRGTGTSGGEAPPTTGGAGGLQVGPPNIGSGVVVIQPGCQPNNQESCNGLDDNCNGQIDEGCGYSSGSIQVTLNWNTSADLDLYVTDPSGESISFQHPQAASGGVIDHDARGNCRAAQPNNRIENAFWSSARPMAGNYQIAVNYWGECGGAGPTTATVSVSVGGRIIGAYNATLSPNQRANIVAFNLLP